MQLSLLEVTPTAKPRVHARPRPAGIAERFESFHAANPHVLEEMLRLARARLDRGETWISVKALWEELRTSLSTRTQEDYRLNNSFTALYSRMLLEVEPRLVGVIETRRRKAR